MALEVVGLNPITHPIEKPLAFAGGFFNEIIPCGICELRCMRALHGAKHVAREIRLRRVKCLRARRLQLWERHFTTGNGRMHFVLFHTSDNPDG